MLSLCDIWKHVLDIRKIQTKCSLVKQSHCFRNNIDRAISLYIKLSTIPPKTLSHKTDLLILLLIRTEIFQNLPYLNSD